MIDKLVEIPTSLQKIKKPPKELYFVGDRELLESKKVSIVGTRTPINYTKAKVYELSSKISKRGAVVVSGGAMGVDAIAHEGARDRTIAIFANSLDHIYPKVNKNLIERIYKNSLALSEYAPSYKATKYSFVLRNRLVVGLGDVLVVAEANAKSGSLTSAKEAQKEGKKIYVLPHRLGESEGTFELLRDGVAEEILDIDSFLDSICQREDRSLLDYVEDEFLYFCAKNPTLQDAILRYGEKVYEYELDGKIAIERGLLRIV